MMDDLTIAHGISLEAESVKYYIPTFVDEFHSNFTFEVDQKEMNSELESKFVECKYGFTGPHISFSDVAKMLRKGKIRVKYLDKKDIEGFGFNYVIGNEHHGTFKKMSKNPDNFPKQLLTLYYNSHKLMIQKRDEYDTDGNVIFDGIIKNKDELFRLMQQLQII